MNLVASKKADMKEAKMIVINAHLAYLKEEAK